MEVAWLAAIVVIALAFDFTNGFHDAANAIATSIGTRALTPRVALAMAAVMNLIGALISTGVAQTVGAGIIATPTGEHGLLVVFAALAGAIAWNIFTWYFGLPTSSSHALIGGLVGAAIAAATTVKWDGVIDKVIIPMVISPLAGFAVAYLLHVALMWAFHRVAPGPANRRYAARKPSPRRLRLPQPRKPAITHPLRHHPTSTRTPQPRLTSMSRDSLPTKGGDWLPNTAPIPGPDTQPEPNWLNWAARC